MRLPSFRWEIDLTHVIGLISAFVALGAYVQAREVKIELLQRNDTEIVATLKELNLSHMNSRIDLADARARLMLLEQRIAALEARITVQGR
jgi:BMFP domain-containing protein YqiC